MVAAAGLSASGPYLGPIVLGAFLAILGSAPVLWLRARGLPTLVAVALVSAVLASSLFILVSALANSLHQVAAALPQYREPLAQLVVQINARLATLGVELRAGDVRAALDPSSLLYLATLSVRGLAGVVSAATLTLVCMIFVLLEAAHAPDKLREAFGSNATPLDLQQVMRAVQHYLVIKTITSSLTGLLIGLTCLFMGLDFALLWGVTAMLLNYIPYVGSIAAGLPAIALAAIQLSPGSSLYLTVAYLVINLSVSNLIEPFMMGKQLGLSPLVVLLSVVYWGAIWGPLGMLLAVPLTTSLRIAMEHSESLRWLAVLMGPRPAHGLEPLRDPE